MRWSVETHAAVDAEIAALPVGLRARLIRLLEMVETMGLDQLYVPQARHIDGKLWELRAKADEGIARGLYVALAGRRVVVLHVFVKKTQKTPRAAIDVALARMKEVER